MGQRTLRPANPGFRPCRATSRGMRGAGCEGGGEKERERERDAFLFATRICLVNGGFAFGPSQARASGTESKDTKPVWWLEEKRERVARDDTGVIFDWIFFNRHLIMIWLEFYLSIRIFFLCSKLCQKSIKRFRTNQNQNLLLLLLLT